MGSILDLGIKVVTAIQGLGGWLTVPMKFFSFLGTEDFFMFVLPVIFWCVDMTLGLQVAFILLTSSCVNEGLKLALRGPRPYWYSSKVKGLVSETSFGVPSNHAQTGVGVWGMLAAGVKRAWAWILAILIILVIGFSRLYLGVHFPHDMLVGWLIGGLLLWLTLRFWKPIAAWLKKLSTLQQILVGFAFSILLLVPILIARFSLANWQIPAQWVQNAAASFPEGPLPNPTSIQGSASDAGTIFGMALGLALLVRWGGFQMKGEWWKLVLRFLVGVVGVFIIRYGLKAIFPDGETALELALRYLRYTFIGAWVTGGAPWAFVRLKLAEKTK